MPNLRHRFVSPKADGGDATIVRPSNWNDKLVYTDGAGAPSSTDAVVRQVLNANTTFFVRTTGNDSNDGTSSGTAWLTLQHAMDVYSAQYDTGGFTITTDIGSGSFAGLGLKPVTGGGIIKFIGAGIASTTITDGPNDGTYNAGQGISALIPCVGTSYDFGSFLFDVATHSAVDLRAPCQVRMVTDWAINLKSSVNSFRARSPGAIFQDVAANSTINAGTSDADTTLFNSSGSGFLRINSSQTFTGTPLIGVFFNVSTDGVVENQNVGITGTVNAATVSYLISGGGQLANAGVMPDDVVSGAGAGPGFIFESGTFDDANNAISTSGFDFLSIAPTPAARGGPAPRTYATLPAASGNYGLMALIDDSTTATNGATVAGGGAHKALVWSDGTNWKCVVGT